MSDPTKSVVVSVRLTRAEAAMLAAAAARAGVRPATLAASMLVHRLRGAPMPLRADLPNVTRTRGDVA